MQTIQTFWKRIDTWFSENASSIWDPSSSPGATEEQIEQAEAILGVTLTEEFKAFYRIHNGGCPFPPHEHALALGNIVGVWDMFKEHHDNGDDDEFPDEPPGPVKPSHWLPGWIPFVGAAMEVNMFASTLILDQQVSTGKLFFVSMNQIQLTFWLPIYNPG